MMRKNALILSLVLLIVLLLPTGAALANSAAPPTVAWFTLEYAVTPAPRLLGIQLVGCPDEVCAQPELLQQYGICEATGCLPGPATLLSGWMTSFDCAGNRCRASSYNDYGGMDFRLVAHFSDQVRISTVTGKLPASFGEEAAWTVTIGQADLSIRPADSIPAINPQYELLRRNLGWLGLSIVIEVVVAGASLRAWARSDRHQWLSRLLVVFLANLATLPLVWMFFPAFGRFQSAGNRYLAFITLIFSVFYVATLVIIYRAPTKTRYWAIPVLVVGGLATILGCLVLSALSYFGGYTVYVQGLSPTVVIAASEVFAVVAEALLIATLCRLAVRTGWVWAVSLLMNAASFLVGLALMGR